MHSAGVWENTETITEPDVGNFQKKKKEKKSPKTFSISVKKAKKVKIKHFFLPDFSFIGDFKNFVKPIWL